MRANGIDLLVEQSLREKALQWLRAVKLVLPPKDISDQVALKNLKRWLIGQCEAELMDENTIFREILDFAIEASGPRSRNPMAVFISILKKELEYLKK